MTVQERTKVVEEALDSIRHHLQVDGGDVELVEVTEDGTVSIKWLGACMSCSMSTMTLRAGIEQSIRAAMPDLKEVIAVNGIEVS